jgi:hypothetical protein
LLSKFGLKNSNLKNLNLDNFSTFHTWKTKKGGKEGGGEYQFETKGVK